MTRPFQRVLCAVALAFALTGAIRPGSEADREQAQAQRAIANSVGTIAATYQQQADRAEGQPKTELCGPSHYGSNAELCAEWKSADAASEGTHWAIISGFVGMLSLLGVVVALWIARDTAQKQLRAYVGIESACIDEDGSRIRIVFKNFGQTPCHGLLAQTELFEAEAANQSDHNFGIIEPGGEGTAFLHLDTPFDLHNYWYPNRPILAVKVSFEYEDIYETKDWRNTELQLARYELSRGARGPIPFHINGGNQKGERPSKNRHWPIRRAAIFKWLQGRAP